MVSYKKLGGAGLIALAVVLFFVLIIPSYQALGEARAEIEKREEEVRSRTEFSKKIQDFSEKIEARQEDLEKLATLLPPEKKIQDVVVNLETIASQAGVQIIELKTGSGDGASIKPYRVVQVELTTLGSYSSLITLLQLLERNLRIFDVQDIVVDLKDKNTTVVGEASLLSLDIKFNTYFLRSTSQ